MTEIIGIRFSPAGKIYYFSPQGHTLRMGDKVIVETSRGIEMGTVSIQNRTIDDASLKEPLKPILRLANDADFEQLERNREKEREAFGIASKEIARHQLEMKLIRVEYTFDGSKILFYFTADGRVDFRELVKSLAGVFRTRIELRQIGVRDEAKHLGALGICGRYLCCSSFLEDFQPVSIKMAKEQGLSLNPTKISGVCGRLMCCLQYEQDGYEEMLRQLPRIGAAVSTPDGDGTVSEINVLKGIVKVRIETGEGTVFGQFTADEITVLKGGRPERNPEEGEPAAEKGPRRQTANGNPRTDNSGENQAGQSAEESGEAADSNEEKAQKPKKKRFHKRKRPSGGSKEGKQPQNKSAGQ